MATSRPAAPVRDAAARIPLGLAQAVDRTFGAGGPFGNEDEIYFTDLMDAYGLECRPAWFGGRRNAFREMVEAMVPSLEPPGAGFDVAVLTGVTPDAQPGFPIARLHALLPHLGVGYAVADQGVVAPFTALRLLGDGLRADGGARALMLVVEQSTFLHDEPVPARLRVDRDSAVALVFGTDSDIALHPPELAPTAGRPPAELLRQSVDRHGASVVVCGSTLAEQVTAVAGVDEFHAVAPGRPATGVWAVVAAELSRWRRTGARVLLADADPDQRRLGTCLLEVPAA
jgi:hypothetical protein